MKPADVRVHPAGALEEEAAILRDRLVLAEQVLEHRGAGAVGMDPLRDLGELERVAEQDERPRRGAHRERVGERDLAGLVDEEVVERLVELLVREQPGGAGDEVDLGVGEAVLGDLDERPLVARRPSSARGTSTPSASATFSTSRSRLWIDLWLCEVTPTRLPRAIRWTISRAPVHVLPEPGGPCTNRWLPSTRSTSRFISSSAATWTRSPSSGGSRRSTPSRCG